MSAKKDKVQIWVHPTFKKTLKKRAIDKNTDVLSLTEDLAKSTEDFEGQFIKGIKRLNKNFGRLI